MKKIISKLTKVFVVLAVAYFGVLYVYPAAIHLIYWNDTSVCFYDFPFYSEISEYKRQN